MPEEEKLDAEKAIKRNPHPDFKKVEASRPPWSASTLTFTQTAKPDWKLGDGANDGGECLKKKHVGIDPYEEGRPATFNYKLLISAIVPRPVGFVGTISEDGNSTNLAPYSYFNIINHDPPLFILGFSGGYDRAKDTLKNLMASKVCSVNIISEHFLEASNATSINAPHGTSEWVLSGLTPAPCTHIPAPRVAESIFSIEAKLYSTQEFESRQTPGKKTSVMAIVEGVKFWAREDALNEDKNLIDLSVLKPICRLGGITYGRISETVELTRPDFKEALEDGRVEKEGLLKSKTDRGGEAQL